MKSKILLLFCISIFLYNSSFAQGICGTPTVLSQKNQTYFSKSSTSYPSSICLNVFFHIIRSDSGTGGINPNDLGDIMDNLNLFYNSKGIYFNNTNGFDYINSSNHQQIGDYNEAVDLSYINNDSNSINYYIVESLWNTPTGYVTGTAIDIPSNSLVIRRDRVVTSTSPHEVGHCLNLFHTFQGTATGTSGCSEAIDGSNCATCGDEVCDTPADANVGNANGYSPDLTNIMSYYNNRDHFTDEQSSRMIASIMSIPIISQLVSSSCSIPEITGSDLICSGSSYTFTLQNPPATVTWHTGPEVSVISQTSTSITIQALNNYISGKSFVEINGGAARKNFYVGAPNIYTLNADGTKNYMGQSFSYSYSNSTREIEVFSDALQFTYTWEMFPTNIQWTAVNNKATFYVNTPGNYVLTCKAENDCGERLIFFTINIESGYNYSIYPNPVSNEIKITPNNQKVGVKIEEQKLLSQQDKQIAKLFDFNGAFVKDIELDPFGTTKMDVSTLKEGMYFLKIQEREKEETYKIIVAH